MQEKRNFPRFRLEQLIEVSYGRETFLAASGVNLSEGGMLVRTDKPLEPYSRMFVMISFGADSSLPPLTIDAMVLRTEKADVAFQSGLEFIDVTTDQRNLIAQALAETKASPT